MLLNKLIMIPTLILLILLQAAVVLPLEIQDEKIGDARTLTPWIVAIFIRRNAKKPFKYFISGSILNPTTILSLYGGTFGKPTRGSKYFIPNPKNIKIVAALQTTRLRDQDQFSQSPQVNFVVPFTQHSVDNKVYHYYVIHLRKALNLTTPYVRAICLENEQKQSENEKELYFLGGYSPQNNVKSLLHLNIKEINLTSTKDCSIKFQQYYHQGTTHHVICGFEHHSPEQTKNDACILHGGALFYEKNQRWFLHGVNALLPSLKTSNKCTEDSIYIFGNFRHSFNWILQNIQCGPTSFVCTTSGSCIPYQNACNSIVDCSHEEDENSLFCEATNPCPSTRNATKFHRCGLYEKCITENELCNGHLDCDNRSDEAYEICDRSYHGVHTDLLSLAPQNMREKEVPKSPKSCFPIQLTEGVVATCRNPDTNKNVPCDDAMPGTEVTLSCDEQYRSTSRSANVRMRCGRDRIWSPFRHFVCEIECGIIGTGFSFHLTFGKTKNKNNAFPWYASIYKKNKRGSMKFICGGNLIEKNAIITAAHCITNANGVMLPNNLFTIILSPVSNDYEINLADRFTQVIQVAGMFIPPTFNFQVLQSDIAILKLAKPAILNDFVRPVCYLPSLYGTYPTPGTIGKIAGLGYDETRQVSKVVKYLPFPVVSQDECHQALNRIPPLATFCAGHKNGTAVCKGDSGGGLAFPELNGVLERYVLKGIVSHGQLTDDRSCDKKNYAIFTHVDSFKPFIVSVLDAIEKNLTVPDDYPDGPSLFQI